MTYAALQQHRIRHGLCCYCGKEPIASKRADVKCLEKRARQARSRTGYSAQEETGLGRPRTIQLKK